MTGEHLTQTTVDGDDNGDGSVGVVVVDETDGFVEGGWLDEIFKQ